MGVLATCVLALYPIFGFVAADALGNLAKIGSKAGCSTTSLSMVHTTSGSNTTEEGTQRPRKRIAFIRHGRSHMNDFINGIHYGQPGFTDVFTDTQEYRDMFYDSPLGPTGQRQVDQLDDKLQRFAKADVNAALELSLPKEHVDFLDELDIVITSPLTRALQTMDQGLYPSVRSRGIPVLAVPQAAERIFLVSDLGKTRRQLKEKYPYVDFDSAFPSHVGEEDAWHFVPTKEEAENYIEWRPHGEGQVYACLGEAEHLFSRRMEELYSFLDSRPESMIAVVCHAGVILWFCGEVVDNCEIRIVDFENLDPRRYYELPNQTAKESK